MENKKLNMENDYFSPQWAPLRILLIVSLLIAWISAACIGKTGALYESQYESTKIGFLVISIAAFCTSIFIFILNVIELPVKSKLPWDFVFAVVDIVFALAIVGISVAAACAEAIANSLTYKSINKGAFAVAASFGFLAFILYVIIIIVELIQVSKNLKNTEETKETSYQREEI
ncbi:unnamed protein product [Brachionus calyciflorus]|uniref:MARVEL domain-containing protein n=1 Tax=Brachionus calyciflorus TaxID=104777 RepID=A0A814PLS8_9BILA|nr:unnamed protein product [Brachionus calyciflorus]